MFVAVGCGSTVPLNEVDQAAEANLEDGQAVAADSGTGTTGAVDARSAKRATARAGVAPGQDIRNPGAAKGPPSVAPKGPGWDEKNIYVGVVTNQDIGTFAATIGINSLDSGDQRADAEALIAEVNAKGGLFGRVLKGIYYDVKSTDPAESSAQAVCSYFTEDHKVIAVMNGAPQNDIPLFQTCMAKRRTLVFGATTDLDNELLNGLDGWYYATGYSSWDLLAPVLVNRLVAQKYFSGWDPLTGSASSKPTKVGIVAPDNPVQRRIVEILNRQLARAGYKASDTFFYSGLDDIPNAVLQMSSRGVTHIVSPDLLIFFFMQNAESQHYRPRYGLSTHNVPGLLLQGVVPNAQLEGSLGFGFAPTGDVDAAHDPGDSMTPSARECRDAAARHGVKYPSDKRYAHFYIYFFCDQLKLITMGAIGGGGLGPEEVRTGVGRVGSTLSPASTFRNGLAASRRSLPAAGLDLSWNSSCACFAYSGELTGF